MKLTSDLDIICIYKITNPKGRIYIGQTVNLRKRINHYRKLHCHKQVRLYNSLLKYGFEKHKIEILTECDKEKLNHFERFYQDFYDVTSKHGLNSRLVEYTDRIGGLSEEAKQKISLKNSGKGNGMYGKKIKESSKQLQREKLCGANNYLSKLVLNTETGIFYDCLTEAAFSANMIKGTLWANIVKQKKNKTSFIYA